MKERPIIFSAPMVRALLDGRKTMTRRLVKPQPVETDDGKPWRITSEFLDGGLLGYIVGPQHCQYGMAGDRLWVRETWAIDGLRKSGTVCQARLHYKADGRTPKGQGLVVVAPPETKLRHPVQGCDGDTDGQWRSPLHMFRWASRITFEITDVRVERLHGITEADAQAEGIDVCEGNRCAVGAFEELWGDIHGPSSWELNPWVWAISFQRVEVDHD